MLEFPDQGMTEMLSKFWMLLDELTEKEVSDLRQGNLHIPVGTSAGVYEAFNVKANFDRVVQSHQQWKQAFLK
jgi:hypothetical protein